MPSSAWLRKRGSMLVGLLSRSPTGCSTSSLLASHMVTLSLRVHAVGSAGGAGGA
jgi:hypothetical protein